MVKSKNTIILFVMAMTFSCFGASGQSEVDRLRQASAMLQSQRQSGQQQLNRDTEELNRRIQAYNNALAAKRPASELDQLKRNRDAAQQKVAMTQRALNETTTNLQQVVQRLQEAQRLESQRRNEEVDRLRRASVVLQGQRQSGQEQLNRDTEELNRRIQGYNNALAAKRSAYELDQLKRNCDAAQQKVAMTQRALNETTTNLQQVVQRLQEAQRLENQRANEEGDKARLKYEEDVRREQQAQAERKRQEQQKSQAGSTSPGVDNASGKFIKWQPGIVGRFQGNAYTPGPSDGGSYASIGGQVGQEGWLDYPIYVNVGPLTDANKWNVAVTVAIGGNWRADSGLMVDFVYPQDSSPQNAKQTVHTRIDGNDSRATHLFADIISEGRQVVHVGSVRVRARDGQTLATAFRITITSILASPAK